MILADTNVLLGFVREMNEDQARVFDDSLDRLEHSGERLLITEAVFVECAWVLASFYRLTPAEVAETLDHLLSGGSVVAWDRELADEALAILRAEPHLDVVDCLLAARVGVDGAEVATLDRRLGQAILGRASAKG